MKELTTTVEQANRTYNENSNLKTAHLASIVNSRIQDIKAFNQLDIEQREALRRELDLTLLKYSENYIQLLKQRDSL